MKKIFVSLTALISLFLLSSILFIGCKKDLTDLINLPPNPSDSSFDEPAFTAVGTPVGNPVTKTIGVAGGSLVSDDGRIELTIPAGALSGDKEITIQPITNECPGGIGLAYDLQPEGTRFAQPASLKFHYTDEDLGEMDPYLFFMAYQDSTSEWMADIIWRDVDTLAKTVTSDIKHFSGHALGSSLHIISDPQELLNNKTSNVRAVKVLDAPPTPKGSEEADLTNLKVEKQLSNVSEWRVVGGSSNGTISGFGSTATYTSPAFILKRKVITVSATYKVNSTVEKYNKGKKQRSSTNTNSITVSGTITLLPTLSYDVIIEYHGSGTNECFLDNYTDGATMRVNIVGDEVSVSDIANRVPQTDRTSGKSDDGNKFCEWQNVDSGYVHITAASGEVTPLGDRPGIEKTVIITLQGDGHLPTWKVSDTRDPSLVDNSGGEEIPPFPPSFGFKLNNKVQETTVTTPANATGHSGTAKISIFPRQ